ncbi:hypothetical protein Ahy_B08g092899 [Arachis hypogaea]|uniref:Uncharacterized protein n=1 Tax=Arachis hypogaea TaxID=3818 RepID=A0A444Y516_ARAHY|nr:hypothetical protein Ahy_B08g092899 [Arachis hypogaea]
MALNHKYHPLAHEPEALIFKLGLMGCARPLQQCKAWATHERTSSKLLWWPLPPQKINLISCEPMAHISDIKLIRTDTTLDLSQKAEKGQDGR